jgi:hypothetical protein
MKRVTICCNVFFLIISGCSSLSTSKVRMALFVEQESGRGEAVVEMKVFRASPKVFFVASNPVLEVGKGVLNGAILREGSDKVLSLELHFTSRGKALLQDITTRYRQQRLFVVVAMPDEADKKRIVSRCIGVYYVQKTIDANMFQFTPDTNEAEAIEIVNGLNKALR